MKFTNRERLFFLGGLLALCAFWGALWRRRPRLREVPPPQPPYKLPDAALHPLVDGQPRGNLYAIGSVLGGTRPELGSGAGLVIRTAFLAVDKILESL